MDVPDSPLRQYLQILRRQGWIVLLVPALTIGATYALVNAQKQTYRAGMTLVVGEPTGPNLPPELGRTSVVRTMTNLVESDLVARRVIKNVGLDVSKDAFLKDLSVKVLPDTSVLDVTYDSTDRKLALRVVEELARIFTRQLDETLGVSGSGSRTQGRSFDLVVRVFDPPHIEPEPLPTNKGLKLIFGAVAGFVLGLVLAGVRDSLDSRLRGRRDAETSFGAPVIGALPRRLRGKTAIALDGARRPREDDFGALQLLRANLEFSRAGIAGDSILVTSALDDEGKTVVAANLAAVIALAGRDVICVDADIRKPSLHRYVNVEAEGPGYAELVEGRASLDDVLEETAILSSSNGTAASADGNGSQAVRGRGRLRIVRAGTMVERSLPGEAVETVVRELGEAAEYVIFNGPPLLMTGDAFPLALSVDTILVAAKPGRTTRERAHAVRTTLDGLGTNRIAIVLTDAPARLAAAE